FTAAHRYHIKVGDQLTLDGYLGKDVDASRAGGGPPPQTSIPVTVRVVGITAPATEFPPRTLGDGVGTMLLTPAFVTHHSELINSLRGIGVRLQPGASYDTFRADVERIAGMDY